MIEYRPSGALERFLRSRISTPWSHRRFARIAKRVSRHKPIIAVKAGRTNAGKRAASSHTAALAASDVAVDALFHQTGVIRAGSLDEMFDLATALSAQPLPQGRRVAILTNAGGLGVLCADTSEANGLSVQELSEGQNNSLKNSCRRRRAQPIRLT